MKPFNIILVTLSALVLVGFLYIRTTGLFQGAFKND